MEFIKNEYNEYIATEHLYRPRSWYWWCKIQVFNNKKGMDAMTVEDIDLIQYKLDCFCWRLRKDLIEYKKNKKSFNYLTKI